METEILEKDLIEKETLKEENSKFLHSDFELFKERETGSRIQQKDNQNKGESVLVIILLAKNPNFKGILKPYEIVMYGKKMWEWVALAASGHEIKTIACTPESDITSLIKPLLNNAKYTFVLYSDTPLLTKRTFDEILHYVESRELNVLKITRGYVFNTDYIRNASSISAIQTQYFEEEDFITAYSLKQVAIINEILKGRILSYHMDNGVIIEDISSTHIDGEVIIEPGTVIAPNNIIKGTSFIGKDCILASGNIIENSIISDRCTVVSSFVNESRVSENIIVGPFEVVQNKSV